jgi:hypothetical protein
MKTARISRLLAIPAAAALSMSAWTLLQAPTADASAGPPDYPCVASITGSPTRVSFAAHVTTKCKYQVRAMVNCAYYFPGLPVVKRVRYGPYVNPGQTSNVYCDALGVVRDWGWEGAAYNIWVGHR